MYREAKGALVIKENLGHQHAMFKTKMFGYAALQGTSLDLQLQMTKLTNKEILVLLYVGHAQNGNQGPNVDGPIEPVEECSDHIWAFMSHL